MDYGPEAGDVCGCVDAGLSRCLDTTVPADTTAVHEDIKCQVSMSRHNDSDRHYSST